MITNVKGQNYFDTRQGKASAIHLVYEGRLAGIHDAKQVTIQRAWYNRGDFFFT